MARTWIALLALGCGIELDAQTPETRATPPAAVVPPEAVEDPRVDAVDTGPWTWGGSYSVASAGASLVGEVTGDWAGACLAAGADLDGDGIRDLVVGAPHHSERAAEGGSVYVVMGREVGWTLGAPLAGAPSLVGTHDDQELCRVAHVGDLNRDGLADIEVGSGYHNMWPRGGQYALLGRTTDWLQAVSAEAADGRANAEDAPRHDNLMGRGHLGDMNGDGADDWLLVPHDGRSAYVVSGAEVGPGLRLPADAMLWVSGYGLGFSPAGDVTGDGLADLWGSDGENSYIIEGSASGLPHGARVGEAARTRFQGGLRTVGDVDGDGVGDLALQTASGSHLFFGGHDWPAVATEADADVHIEVVGAPVSAGDVNGDGVADILLRTFVDNDEERVSIVLGRRVWPRTLPAADVEIGPASRHLRLQEPANHGDLNGDGITDLFIRNPKDDWNGAEHAGALHVFLGRAQWDAVYALEDADVRFVGTERWQNMGEWMAIADLDGDSYDDLVVASPRHPVEAAAGESFIFFGQPDL